MHPGGERSHGATPVPKPLSLQAGRTVLPAGFHSGLHHQKDLAVFGCPPSRSLEAYPNPTCGCQVLGGVRASPARYSPALPQKGTELSPDHLAEPQSDFFLSEVIGRYVSSLWNILAVVLISSVSKTADNIPLYFFSLKPSSCNLTFFFNCWMYESPQDSFSPYPEQHASTCQCHTESPTPAYVPQRAFPSRRLNILWFSQQRELLTRQFEHHIPPTL